MFAVTFNKTKYFELSVVSGDPVLQPLIVNPFQAGFYFFFFVMQNEKA